MFHSARIKLTAWYLIIIMAISISFSTFIYFGSTGELNRVIRIEKFHTQHPEISIIQGVPLDTDNIPPLIRQPDLQVLEAEKIRILESLVVVNIFIFLASSLAGYFLAGRTLKPIKNMVDEQNRFITDASHELNTPLTSLKTSIEVNLRDKSLTLQKTKNVLLSNLEEVDNLQALSDELIKIAQYQKANGNFQFEQILLSDIIKAAVQKVNAVAGKKYIVISYKVPKVKIEGNTRSLTELFTILLDNAIKYSPEKTPVKVSAAKVDSKIKIVVEDKGIGIEKEVLPHIFDRFYRADKSRTKQNVAGYGLGLSIAKRIVALHRGTISVESEVGKGTVFTLYFPSLN